MLGVRRPSAGSYRLVAEGPVIETAEPVAVRIDVAALTDPI